MTTDSLSWQERWVLQRARWAAAVPSWWTRAWYVVLAAVAAWFAGGSVSLWHSDREAAGVQLVYLIFFAALVFVSRELDVAFDLLNRPGPGEGPAPGRDAPSGAEAARALRGPDVRRLIRAPAYAAQLERLRWLLPVLAAGAIGSAVAALAWADVPRPLDLIVAGMAGVSIAAVVAVAALRGWVRLAVVLSQRGGGATG